MTTGKRYVRLTEPSLFDTEGQGVPVKPKGAVGWFIPTGATFEVLEEPGPTSEDVMIWLPTPFEHPLEFWIGDEESAVFVDGPAGEVSIEPLFRERAVTLFPHLFGGTA